MIQPLWRMVWRFLNKLVIKLPHDPEIPLLGIYPEKTRSQKEKDKYRVLMHIYGI